MSLFQTDTGKLYFRKAMNVLKGIKIYLFRKKVGEGLQQVLKKSLCE